MVHYCQLHCTCACCYAGVQPAGLGVTSSDLYANKQADLYEEKQARLYEEQQAALCDSGLPDTEVCDVLQVPPTEMPIFSEAWSRG